MFSPGFELQRYHHRGVIYQLLVNIFSVLLDHNILENRDPVLIFVNDIQQSVLCIQKDSESEVAQSCPTLCDPMDCNLPCSSIHGIFQARVLEWVAISSSRGSSRPRDQTQVSHIIGRRFTV